MKYSDHPMPLKEGEYPWEHIMVFDAETRKWKDQWRQLEEADKKEAEAEKWEGETPETDTYYLSGKEEYYDFETVCKACGTQFMAYAGEGIETKAVRNFCPGCGKKLIEKEDGKE